MKKSFLLCLTMLLCCVTGVWGATVTASSGTGTQEDPFVFNVSDGDNVDLQQGQYGKFVFAASAAGNLSIRPSGFDNDCYLSFTYGIADDVMQAAEYDGINGIIKVDGLEAGLTYQIVHSVASYENCNFSFEFDGGGGDEPGGGDVPGSDEGTEENPYVVSDGEEFFMRVKSPDDILAAQTYAKFTAPIDGYVVLTQTSHKAEYAYLANNVYYFGISTDGSNFDTSSAIIERDCVNPVVTRFPVKAGQEYWVRSNTGLSAWSQSEYENMQGAVGVIVTFEELSDDAFQVVSAEPAVGSALASVRYDNPILVTLNRTRDQIPHIEADFTNNTQNVAISFVSEDTDAGTSTWSVGPVDMRDVYGEDYVSQWVLYEGTTYTMTLEVYPEGQTSQGGTPIETCQVTYEGATEPEQYSDIKLIRVTPGNDATEEEMLNEENHVFEIEFDGKVEIESMNIAQGQFGSIPLSPVVEYTDEGHTIVKADVGTPTRNDYIYAIVVTAKDAETGLYLNDPDPELPGVTWAGYAYSFDIPCSTGRWFDTSLGVDDITPLENSYVTKLDRVYFTMTGAGDQDGYYGKTANAEDAALYNEAGDMVAYATLWQDDERGREEFDPSQSVGGMGGEAVYVDGTTKYFYAEFTDLNGTGTPV